MTTVALMHLVVWCAVSFSVWPWIMMPQVTVSSFRSLMCFLSMYSCLLDAFPAISEAFRQCKSACKFHFQPFQEMLNFKICPGERGPGVPLDDSPLRNRFSPPPPPNSKIPSAGPDREYCFIEEPYIRVPMYVNRGS